MKHYPCDIRAGEILVMRDGRRYKIKLFDGRYIKTLEGVTIRPKHVDIEGFEEDVAVIEKTSESVSEEEAPKKTKGRKRKEEVEEVTEDKTEEE